jgi:hypothetical protein
MGGGLPLAAKRFKHYSFDFANGTDGSGPYGTLVQGTDGNFYGVTKYGGANNYGIVCYTIRNSTWRWIRLLSTSQRSGSVTRATCPGATHWISRTRSCITLS